MSVGPCLDLCVSCGCFVYKPASQEDILFSHNINICALCAVSYNKCDHIHVHNPISAVFCVHHLLPLVRILGWTCRGILRE